MVPGVCLEGGCAVAEHVAAGAGGEFEADRAWSAVDGGVELEADVGAGAFGDDRGVVAGEGGRVDPGADRHAAGELQRGRVAEVDEVVAAVELDGTAVAAGAPAGTVGQRSRQPVAGRIGRGCPGRLIERVGGAGGGSGCG